jgi:hypothetical protein
MREQVVPTGRSGRDGGAAHVKLSKQSRAIPQSRDSLIQFSPIARLWIK